MEESPDEWCPMCRGLGWIFDARLDKTPLVLEILPCLLPDCGASGRHVEHMSVNLMGFRRAVTAPGGLVMALAPD